MRRLVRMSRVPLGRSLDREARQMISECGASEFGGIWWVVNDKKQREVLGVYMTSWLVQRFTCAANLRSCDQKKRVSAAAAVSTRVDDGKGSEEHSSNQRPGCSLAQRRGRED